ncbi:MAG: tRNA (adenosine(37)-N6)-dimethylallyltransferase MiaA [Oscillospiraceae bacterium]|nr:tRNA (adenosine(37)-N6)-dimethylallyltransferase MiaA [Oscillospiraceae bacterium]
MARGVLVITGPTATGKTALGVWLALHLGGEVVSADAMQVYRGMVIGTAAPTAAEMKGVPHHLVGTVDPRENYSVGRYVQEASACVEDILRRGKLPILVGGTNLYIDSLLRGIEFSDFDPAVRSALEAEYDRLGGEAMLDRLQAVDPERAALLHPRDRKRIVRALEIYETTGETITAHDQASRLSPPRFRSCRIALSFEQREDLYARIDARVDGMIKAGLAEEVKGLLDSGVPENCTAMQAIGYKEIASALRGETTLEEAAEQVKQSSRRYAKRQLSWLRRDPELQWILWKKKPDLDKASRISTQILEISGIL